MRGRRREREREREREKELRMIVICSTFFSPPGETIQSGTAIRANREGSGKRICHSRNHPMYSSPALRVGTHVRAREIEVGIKYDGGK